MIFWRRTCRIFSRFLKSFNVRIYQQINYQDKIEELWRVDNGMKERKQRTVLKRKKADEGITWKKESIFLRFIFVVIKELDINVIKFNHGKRHCVPSIHREGIEYNLERDAWPQQLEGYTCIQIEQQNSKPCTLETNRNLHADSLQFKKDNKLAAEISSWKRGIFFLRN